jgi:hypothetical protein
LRYGNADTADEDAIHGLVPNMRNARDKAIALRDGRN